MTSKHTKIAPENTLGMLGGGQLGRMFALAAAQMGYKVWVFDPSEVSPAGEVADKHIQADYDDYDALLVFGKECAVVTTEFENIPAKTLEFLEEHCAVCPNPRAVHIAQNRIREKQFINDLGIPTANFIVVEKETDLDAADIQWPSILKTAQFGYDGKGQQVVNTITEAKAAFKELGKVPCVLEERVQLVKEISIVLGRNYLSEVCYYPPANNEHHNGILHISSVPANITSQLQTYACDYALRIAEALDYVGILAVEYFIDQHGNLLVNEIAPRVHNSGHYTMDACHVSQFEQQVRMICGWPPSDTQNYCAVAMVNILGDAWVNNELPAKVLLEDINVKLHLYGKSGAKPGRKMGHFNVLADNVNDACRYAHSAYKKLMRMSKHD